MTGRRRIFADTHILSDLLQNGPITARQLMKRIDRAESTVGYALHRLEKQGLVQIVGRGARGAHNVRGHVPAIWDIGPQVHSWALRTVKPRDDE